MAGSKLYRSRDRRIIAGVCGGIAEYANIPPLLVRIAFVLLGLASGAGAVLYAILALVLPAEPEA